MTNFAGIAIDIGTTTIQARLVDLSTGKILDTFSAFNEQRVFGADVMSRISSAKNGKLNDLYFVINKQTENILSGFINKHKLSSISKCIVSGNTTMLHLFCRADPSAMGSAPYTPIFLEERNFKGADFSLSAEDVTLLPGISAFVGADITAGLAEVNIIEKGEDALFIDIGTNGEIAVWKESEKKLYCCSSAAGPCFEEAEISCGLCAVDFINAIAEMKRGNIFDETGAIIETGAMTKAGSSITQKDIRQFQLAKSAIYSGIKTICKIANLDIKNLGAVYIAGGIGLHLNLENAVEVGLLPKEFAEEPLKANTLVCGNTSLKGAVKSLTDSDFLLHCRKIVSCAETIDLANNKYFAAAFEHNMRF